MSDTYIPGTCNLGKSEVRRRQVVALGGALLALFSGIGLTNAPAFAQATMFLPFMVFSIGYIQSRKKFCMAYGFAGAFNLGKLGEMAKVSDPADRAADRKMAFKIVGQSALLALVLTVAFIFVSL